MRRRTVLYDHECYRVLAQDFLHLETADQKWPLVRYGTITTFPTSQPHSKLDIHYSVQFTSSGSAQMEFSFFDPFNHLERKQIIEVNKGIRRTNRIYWRFNCPINQAKYCPVTWPSLWLGKYGRWGCQECAKIKRYSKCIEDGLRKFRKNPNLIISTLSDPSALESKKRFAYIALEKLNKRFRRMTANYENLTVWEKRYYGKLRAVLFRPISMRKIFNPSDKLTKAPLPFQTIW